MRLSLNTRFRQLIQRTKTARASKVFFGLVIAIVLLQIACVMLAPSKTENYSADLIKGYDWSDFDGAKASQQGVLVSPLERKIVKQDGSGGQPNPSVNLSGPSVRFRGKTSFTVVTSDFSRGAFRIYAGVPLVYDEWRLEPSSIELAVEGQTIKASVWDGMSSSPNKTYQFKLNSQYINSLSIEFDSKKASIEANGQELGHLYLPNSYNNLNVWFGASASKPWTIKKLSVQSDNPVKVSSGLNWNEARDGQGLQALATKSRPDIKIGAAVSLNQLLTDGKYRKLALGQFGLWTTENALKPQFVHPAPNVYEFKEADLLVNTALKNGIAIHGHTLVFGEANPRWMQTAKPADRQAIMTEHIKQVVGHYKGKINEWDVVNEPLSDEDSDYDSDGLRHNIWYQAMGENYIASALKTTKATDPDAKLYINDYGLEADGQRWDAMINLIERLQSEGVPLDGIGFEAHVYDDGDEIDGNVLAKHIEQLRGLGLKSRISEIDVHGDDPKLQAQQYGEVLAVCLREPSCTSYTTWGITDLYGSTTEQNTYPSQYGDDLIWDNNYNPKQAYNYLINSLNAKMRQ